MSSPSSSACFTLLPPELIIIIFQTACDDDGTTARSLVSTSRAFYPWALPFIYRAIATHDVARTKLLTEHLQREPHHASLVRHILVAEGTPALDCLAFERTLKTLWGLVSSTLQSLTLLVNSRSENVGKVFQTVFDTSLPCLTDLTLGGEHPVPTSPLTMPALQRFHTAGLIKRNAASCFAPLTQSCPQLSHIRISMASEHNLTYAISAAFDLPGAPTDLERMCLDPIPASESDDTPSSRIPFPSLPSSLVSLSVKPAAPPVMHFPGGASMFYDHYIKQLKDLVPACQPGKLQLLPAFKRAMWDVEGYDTTEAKRDWVDAMRGGMGAWGAHTRS